MPSSNILANVAIYELRHIIYYIIKYYRKTEAKVQTKKV